MTLDARRDRTELRLRLYDNGFAPLANRQKMCLIREWSTLTVTPELIRSREWARSSRFQDTGIRCGDVVALDWDIDDGDLLNDLLDEVVNRKLVDESLFVRVGKPPRELWVYRTTEKIGKRTTGHFVPAGAPEDHKGFAVEILGAGCQFAAFGQRDDATAYSWPEESLLDHRYMDLPEITKAQADAIRDFAIEFFEARGLERRSPAGGTDKGYTLAYDLTDDMEFDVHEMGVMSLPEIVEALRHSPEGEVLRCKVQALRPTGGSWAGMISLVGGMVCLSDHGTYTSHFPFEADIRRHTEKLGALLKARFPEPILTNPVETIDFDATGELDPHRPLDENLKVALRRFAYIEETNSIYDIRRPRTAMTVEHYRTHTAQFYAEDPGPMGGKRVSRLADLWLQHADRINAAGVGMRPDRAWPAFREDGVWQINTYRPVVLPDAATGDAAPGFDFLERLLPVRAEREYFTRWLSYKVQNPAVRGPGIMMVANDTFGTGRGTLAGIIRQMFAPGLVKNIDFRTLSGQTYQSQYNEWLADSLVVVVNEAQEAQPNLTRWQSKTNAYEHLKSIIDPSETDIYVMRKGVTNTLGKTFASIIVMTNHIDALALPSNDRRLAILENGEAQSPAYWGQLRQWQSDPANIAAFVEALRAYPLADYNPYEAPLMTDVKAEMIDAGTSELDRALDAAMRDLHDTMVIKEQVVLRVEDYFADHDVEPPDDWRRMVERMLNRRTRKTPQGVQDRIRIDGRQRVIRVIGKIKPESFVRPDDVLNEIVKNGPTSRAMSNLGKVVSFPLKR